MQIQSIISGAAIAWVASFGTAAAGEVRFSVLGAITATPMTQGEMAVVVGEGPLILVTGLLSPQGIHTVEGPAPEFILASNIGGGSGLGALPLNLAFIIID